MIFKPKSNVNDESKTNDDDIILFNLTMKTNKIKEIKKKKMKRKRKLSLFMMNLNHLKYRR